MFDFKNSNFQGAMWFRVNLSGIVPWTTEERRWFYYFK